MNPTVFAVALALLWRSAPDGSGTPGVALGASPTGETGLVRVHGAEGLEPGRVRLSFALDFFRLDSFIAADNAHTSVGGTLALAFAPLEHLELWVDTRASSNKDARTRPELLETLGDLTLGAKGFLPATPLLAVGADAELTLLTGVGSSSFDLSASRLRLRALASADLQRARGVPLRAHLNAGIIFDGSGALETPTLTNAERFALGISDFNRVLIGAAVEVPLGGFTPFVEYAMEVPLGYLATPGIIVSSAALRPEQTAPMAVAVCNPSAGLDSGCARPAEARVLPQRLTPGVRMTAVPDLTVDFAVELGLTAAVATGVLPVPRYNLVLLASYTLDPFRNESRVLIPVLVPEECPTRAADPRGQAQGIVKSWGDDRGVAGAIVTFDRGPPVATDGEGRFLSHPLDPGPVQVSVTRDGFEPGGASAEIAPGRTATITIALAPRAREGVVRGQVLDPAERPVGGASVTLRGPGTATVTSGLEGEFEVKAPPGRYTLSVSKAGVLSRARRVEVRPDETVTAELLVRPRPPTPVAELSSDGILVKQSIRFLSGQAVLAPDAPAVLDNVVDVLVNHEEIRRLRVEGHSDDVGGEAENVRLSRDRAQAVVDYLVQQGIDPGRLSAEGYGASRPIAPNLTRRGREQNHRVEFHIVAQ